MKNIILIGLLLMSPLYLIAQDAIDLKTAIETALENNYDIRIVRNDQQITTNNATAGNAGLLPTIDLTAGYSGTNSKTTLEYPDRTDKSDYLLNQGANIGLNLNWTLFDGFKMQAEYERLKEFEKMGEINTRLTIENLVASLTAEYYNYIRQTLRYANLKQVLELSRERLRIAELHYSIGSMSRLEMQQARVYFNEDSSSLIKQKEVLNSSAITLNQLMALPDVWAPVVLTDTIIKPNMLLDKDHLWEKTLEANANLLLSEKNKTLSKLDLKTYQSRNYPYLKASAGYGYTLNMYEDNSFDKQKTLGLNYGLTLGFNLFDGNNRRREQRNARIAIETAQLETEQIELALKADLANMWMAYQNNIQLTRLEKDNLKVAQETYNAAMERYKLNDLAGIELREAQNSLSEAQERLLQAQLNTKLCEISLLQISGSIMSYLQ